MDRYEELIKNKEFNKVESEIKELLDKDNKNHKLWYLLFLASNKDFIDFDPYNVNNELAFNKALEYAPLAEETKYKAEYKLNLIVSDFMDFNRLFRFYKYKEYDKCINLLKLIGDNEYSNIKYDDKLIDYIEILFNDKSSKYQIYIQMLILNLFKVITNDNKFLDLIDKYKNNELLDDELKEYQLIYDLKSFQNIKDFNYKETKLKETKNENIEYEEEKKTETVKQEGYNEIADLKKNENIRPLTKSQLDLIKDLSIKGNVEAMCQLGDYYSKGPMYDRNFELAYYYYKKAYNKKSGYAAYRLGCFREKGLGVFKNNQYAKWYYIKAKEYGQSDVIKDINRLRDYNEVDPDFSIFVILILLVSIICAIVLSLVLCAYA